MLASIAFSNRAKLSGQCRLSVGPENVRHVCALVCVRVCGRACVHDGAPVRVRSADRPVVTGNTPRVALDRQGLLRFIARGLPARAGRPVPNPRIMAMLLLLDTVQAAAGGDASSSLDTGSGSCCAEARLLP